MISAEKKLLSADPKGTVGAWPEKDGLKGPSQPPELLSPTCKKWPGNYFAPNASKDNLKTEKLNNFDIWVTFFKLLERNRIFAFQLHFIQDKFIFFQVGF